MDNKSWCFFFDYKESMDFFLEKSDLKFFEIKVLTIVRYRNIITNVIKFGAEIFGAVIKVR